MLIARSVHPLPGEAERRERFLGLIDGFSSRRVLVVGDVIADEFVYGEVARVSREAPVLILKYDAATIVAGGAGNAANNVAALGGRARLAGLVGADDQGRRLLAGFHRGVDRALIVRSRTYRTPVKTRILAGGVHSAKQQVVRIDREAGWPLADEVSRTFAKKLLPALDDCDAVLLSDYGSGLVTPQLATVIRARLAKRPRAGPCRCCSTRAIASNTAASPRARRTSRVEAALGVRRRRREALRRRGAVLRRTACRRSWSRAAAGMALFSRARDHGGGDLRHGRNRRRHRGGRHRDRDALARARGRRVVLRSGAAANYAGGLVVMKRGTATGSAKELSAAVESDHDTSLENWSQEGPPQGRRS